MKFKRNVEIYSGRVDPVPLVNVFFLLLFFILLGSTFMFQPGISINLPVSTSIAPPPVESEVLAITANQTIFFQNKWIQREDLKSVLQQAVTDRPQMTLVLHCDLKVTTEEIVQMTDLASSIGIREIMISTRPASRIWEHR